jgi:hypothetical protein
LGSRRPARGPRLLCALTLGLGLWVQTQSARADEPDAGTRMAARELAMSGAEAFDKQDYATALDRFQRAESLYKVPSIAVMIARCLARVGRVVESVDKYEETLRMPLDASAPDAFQRAVAEATAEVEGVRNRVARLELRLPADPPAELEVTLDERQLPKALWGVPTPVDPGVHHVAARAPGREPYSYDVNLAEGAHQAVEITLAVEKASEPDPAVAQAPLARADSRGKSATLPIALLAGGGVALVAGTVTGIAALSHKSTLDDKCNPGCPASMASELDTFRLTRALSYVGFGVGVVAVGAGAYLLLHQSSSGSQVGALFMPGGAGLAGTF